LQVPAAFHPRRLIAILCVAALLVAVMTSGAHGSAPAIVVPLWLFIEILVFVSIHRRIKDRGFYAFLCISAVAARAPPVR
jgi:hypothetical protein